MKYLQGYHISCEDETNVKTEVILPALCHVDFLKDVKQNIEVLYYILETDLQHSDLIAGVYEKVEKFESVQTIYCSTLKTAISRHIFKGNLS